MAIFYIYLIGCIFSVAYGFYVIKREHDLGTDYADLIPALSIFMLMSWLYVLSEIYWNYLDKYFEKEHHQE